MKLRTRGFFENFELNCFLCFHFILSFYLRNQLSTGISFQTRICRSQHKTKLEPECHFGPHLYVYALKQRIKLKSLSIKSKAFLSRKKNKKKGRNQEKERKEIGGEKKEGKVKKERDHP